MMIGKEDRPPITGAPSNARREMSGKCEFPDVAPYARKSEPMVNKFAQVYPNLRSSIYFANLLYHHSVDLAWAFSSAHTEPVQTEAFSRIFFSPTTRNGGHRWRSDCDGVGVRFPNPAGPLVPQPE
jgi:hypothetical protein